MAYLGKEICGLEAGGNVGFAAAPIIYSVSLAETSVPANTPFHITAKLNRISSRMVAFNSGSGVGIAQGNASITELQDGTKEYRSTIAFGTPGLRSINFYARDASNNQSISCITKTITITANVNNSSQTDVDNSINV